MSEPLFEQWNAYAKILRHDYMAHRDFFRHLRRVADHCFQRPLSILDLGCGDASPVIPLLRSANVARYRGVDDSPIALQIAGANLAGLGIDWDLWQADLADALASLDAGFDLILASYSLHHVGALERKKAILTHCRRLLAPDGLLAVIDIFRAEGESRQRYLERWVRDARRRYEELTAGELETVIDHVMASDFPESPGTYRQIGAEAGFRGFRLVAQDEPGLNAFIILRPDTAGEAVQPG